MSRTRTRISQTLVAILAVVIVVGLAAYLANSRKEFKRPDSRAVAAGVENPRAIPNMATGAPTTPATQPTTAPATQPVQQMSSVSPIIAAKSKIDSGDLLGARTLLNSALLSTKLAESDADACKQTLAEINKTVVFSPTKFPDDEFGGTYQVQSGEILQKIAKSHLVTTELLCRLNGISDPRKLRAGQTLKVVTGPFHAVVTKHNYTIELWLGEPYSTDSHFVTRFKVGLGADNSTPTGKWLVAPGNKLKNPTYHSPRGEGVVAADDPKNPLGEFWLGLEGIDGQAVGKTSYGIHGTIEPDSIGKMASHGCIRMLNEDVAMVFELLVDGKSTVTIQE